MIRQYTAFEPGATVLFSDVDYPGFHPQVFNRPERVGALVRALQRIAASG